jgi:hypothetical protein
MPDADGSIRREAAAQVLMTAVPLMAKEHGSVAAIAFMRSVCDLLDEIALLHEQLERRNAIVAVDPKQTPAPPRRPRPAAGGSSTEAEAPT